MVIRVGAPAAASREPRQARKGATVAVVPGAGVSLARIATYLPVPRVVAGLVKLGVPDD